ncbi:MAG: hypothetical protein QOC81_694 [Thermoanaerobaculia bacterium]|jgi:hypothetical protein|nr:hypothetical protein [Thermoanaerobaculia bacterium]
MRRVSKALATASLVVALTASNVYAVPANDSRPSVFTKIVKIIRHVIGLDLGDMSLPHP